MCTTGPRPKIGRSTTAKARLGRTRCVALCVGLARRSTHAYLRPVPGRGSRGAHRRALRYRTPRAHRGWGWARRPSTTVVGAGHVAPVPRWRCALPLCDRSASTPRAMVAASSGAQKARRTQKAARRRCNEARARSVRARVAPRVTPARRWWWRWRSLAPRGGWHHRPGVVARRRRAFVVDAAMMATVRALLHAQTTHHSGVVQERNPRWRSRSEKKSCETQR